MPTIICNHCQYVGSGEDYPDRIANVEEHEKTCSENPAAMQFWTSNTGKVELEMTTEQAASVSHSGHCDPDVLALSQVPAIAEQLKKIDGNVLRDMLDEFGAWTDEQLADHDQNIQRLVWLAGCDIDEEN